GVAQGGVAEQRPQRRQPGVAAARADPGPPVDVPVSQPGAQPQRHDATHQQPLARLLDPEKPPGVARPVGQFLRGDARPRSGEAAEVDSHRIGFPPVTASRAPEMWLASSEASSTKAGATSAGCPARLSGTCWPKLPTCSAGMVEGISGVQMGPGATLWARMPLSASSPARPAMKFAIPALVTS